MKASVRELKPYEGRDVGRCVLVKDDTGSIFATTSGAQTNDNPWELSRFYWDQPETGWYWVPEGTEASSFVRAADQCGAKTEAAVASHGIVPPGFAYGIFKFVDPSSDAAQKCTIDRLRAVPQLSIYESRR
jgi:hypothetical protein